MFATIVAVVIAVSPPTFEVIDLGVLPDTQTSRAFSLADDGTVCGAAYKNFVEAHCFARGPSARALLSSLPTQGTILDTSGVHTIAMGENECWHFDGKKLATLSPLAENMYVAAAAVNVHGIVVGTAHNADFHNKAVMWTDGVCTEIAPLSTHSFATAISDSGLVVGHGMFDETARAFVYDSHTHTISFLPTLGGTHASARAVANDETIVGSSATETGAVHACLWQQGLVQDLGVLEENGSSYAVANSCKGVIGMATLGGGEVPFLSMPHEGLCALFTCIPTPCDFRIDVVTDINEGGEICGWGTRISDGIVHALLLKPQ
jgi:probable HAF family extracellular repeat protein